MKRAAPSDRLRLTLRNRHPTWRVDTRLLRRLALAACALLPPTGAAPPSGKLAIILLDAPAMARLNERFLRHHGPTDVITFDYAAALPEPVVRTSCLHLPRFMAPGQVRQEEVALPEPVVRASSLHAQSSGSLGLAAEAKDTSPGPGAARVLHGDVFICLDEARRQAREWGTTWPAELVRYVVHGLLHLSGYDDLAPGPRRRLKRVEHRLVRRLAAGFPFNRLGRVGNVRS